MGGMGGPPVFDAACAATCDAGNGPAIQLCVSSSECANGETCQAGFAGVSTCGRQGGRQGAPAGGGG